MNPIEPRAQATLDAAMNLIRTAAASAAMRVAENLGTPAQAAIKITERDQLVATQQELRRNLGTFQGAFLEALREKVAKELAPRVDAEAQARVGRLADAQPGRREGGRGADELRAPRPDDLARVRVAAARARRLHGRAARPRPRRRRAQPAARRDRRRRAAPRHRGDLGRAREPPHPGARPRPGGRPRHARVLLRHPAHAAGARRPARST